MFVDFRGYVDFFLLQDCVSNDHSKVRMWLDTELFESDPLPKDISGYMRWIDSNLDFVESRNRRIASLLSDHRLQNMDDLSQSVRAQRHLVSYHKWTKPRSYLGRTRSAKIGATGWMTPQNVHGGSDG